MSANFSPFGQVQTGTVNGKQVQYARGTDNALWVNDGAGWRSLGGVLTADPWADTAAGGLNIYARGTTGDVYQRQQQGGGAYTPWADIGKTGPAGSPFAAAPNPAPNAAPSGGLGQGWWSQGALVPGWQGGVSGAPNAGNAATTGQLGAGTPDWSIQNGTLLGRLANNPADHTVQTGIMRAAAGYLRRGLSEQQAYNLATSEALANINKLGAAPSTYTIMPYQQGMVSEYANLMDQGPKAEQNSAAWSPALQNYMDQAQRWTGNGWASTGRGDLYTAAAAQQPAPNQSPSPSGNPPPAAPPNTTGNTTPSPFSSPALGGNPANWTGPTQTNDLQNQALLADPETAYRYMMEGQGFNPDQPGLYGSFVHDTEEPLIQHALSLLGLGGGNAAEMTPGFLQSLGTSLTTPGSGGLGKLQNWAQGQSGAFANAADKLTNQQQAVQAFGDVKALEQAGANPLLSQASHDYYLRSGAAYGDYAFQNELGQHHNIDPYIEWMKNGPYAGLFSDIYF